MSDALGFLPDTKPDVAEPWRKVLLDAADYIEAHGWCQGGISESPDGSVCAIRSIHSVGQGRNAEENLDHRIMAGAMFVRHVCGNVINWNDTPGRTASEVTAALRACARQ